MWPQREKARGGRLRLSAPDTPKARHCGRVRIDKGRRSAKGAGTLIRIAQDHGAVETLFPA